MKAILTHEFAYNGLFIDKRPLNPPREVEVLGVMVPCDPGFVTITDGGRQREVPTNVLTYPEGVDRPNIDFERLLTSTQKEERKRFGLLFGIGDPAPRSLVPIKECVK